jgi:hypothetical protein
VLAVAPILPSRDLGATSAFYAPDTDPFTSSGDSYVYNEGADALFAEFERLGLPSAGTPRLHGAPEDSDYGLREFAVVDIDGNLLRIGSSIVESASGQPG